MTFSYFTFSQGDETSNDPDSSLLYGRFRAIARKSSRTIFWNRDRRGSNATLSWFGSIESEHSVDDESTWLLTGLVLSPRRYAVRKVVKRFWTRNIVLNVIPPALTLVWASIPFPTFKATNVVYAWTVLPSDNPDVELNFWFFLFVYYGFYNVVGLFWVTKLFNLYSLNWWPKSLGPGISNLCFWSFSVLLGCIIYFFSGLERYSLTWVCLTFVTMTGPILVAFGKMRYDHRHSVRPPLTETQRMFLFQPVLHIPASYIRFLWFCFVLLIALGAFVLGEAYAYIYLSSLPHRNPVDALIYVYSWVMSIHIFDWLSGWMLGSQISSYPLGLVFKFYYRMIYMVFVRNLYARLHSPKQYAYLSAGSSIGALIIWPTTMTRFAYTVYQSITRSNISYEEYKKNSGRNIYLETLAKNITMIAFLGWVTILHFGPNKRVYPYFSFNSPRDTEEHYSYRLTFLASVAVWIVELVTAWIARRVIGWKLQFEVTIEAAKDLIEYPDIIGNLAAVSVHVLQSMLFSLIVLRFH